MRARRSADGRLCEPDSYATGSGRAFGDKFPTLSLLIPWPFRVPQYPCEFPRRDFFDGNKFPRFFPEPGKTLACPCGLQ